MYKWKGIDLSTKGIIVEKKPTISKGKKRIETYDIYGRNGFLSIDTGSYEPFEVSLECHLDTSVANLDEVKEFLDGYGYLQFESDRQYEAIINNSIPFEVVATKFRSFIIQFLCQPIAEAVQETTNNIGNSPYTVTINDTYTDIYPIIELASTNGNASITMTINGTTFSLDMEAGVHYQLDCKNQEVTDFDGNNASHRMSGDFPKLIRGSNIIEYTETGRVNYMYLVYHKTYL